MNSPAAALRPRLQTEITVSNFTFNLYLLYMISFFLHLSARIPAIAVLRPDLLIAILLLAMLVAQKPKLTGRLDNPCNRYLIIFLAFTILSLPFVEWPGSVLRENMAEFIKAILFYYFTVLIVDTDSRLKRLLFVFVACQLVRVLEPLYLYEVYGYWGSRTYLGGGEFAGRLGGAPSDIINPNGLGLVIATLFPFLHYLWGNAGWILKSAYFSLIAPLLYALILTMSRSGLVALLVIAGSIFLKSRHKFVLIIVCIAIAFAAWSNMNGLQRDRYLSMTGAEDVQGAATFQGRINGIKNEFKVALERPIFGFGLGTSKEALFNTMGGTRLAHDLYTETFIETGIIGLIIFLLFIKSIYDTLKQAARNLARTDLPVTNTKPSIQRRPVTTVRTLDYERKVLLVLSACFWMYIIFSIAQYGLREYHWYLLAGLATVLARRTAKQAGHVDNPPLSPQ
jgi:putative inorganic carbon (hco3(-)) transporter